MLIRQLLTEQQGVLLDLYRGMDWQSYNPEVGTTAVVPIRQDRRPRDSIGALSIMFDLGIERKFGIKNIRRNSLFCSTNPDAASYYALALLDSGSNGTLVQVETAPNAIIVYNQEVDDSIFLQMTMSRKWIAFAKQFCENIDSHTEELKSTYLTMLPEQAIRHFAQQCQIPEESMAQFMDLAYSDSDALVKGYEMSRASTFEAVNDSMECLITGITEYTAHVVEMNDDY